MEVRVRDLKRAEKVKPSIHDRGFSILWAIDISR